MLSGGQDFEIVVPESLHDGERLHQRVQESIAILPERANPLEHRAALFLAELIEVLDEARDVVWLARDIP